MLKIEVKKPGQKELNALGIDNWGTWGCEVSRFDWEYDDKETCYLFEGEVTVETEWETVNIGAGDLVVFPSGLKCTWDVKKPVRKVYKFDYTHAKK